MILGSPLSLPGFWFSGTVQTRTLTWWNLAVVVRVIKDGRAFINCEGLRYWRSLGIVERRADLILCLGGQGWQGPAPLSNLRLGSPTMSLFLTPTPKPMLGKHLIQEVLRGDFAK